MDFTTRTVTEKLTSFATLASDSNMLKAIEDNIFHVIAIYDFVGNISVGSMEDEIPAFFSTLDEAQSENQCIIDDIQEQIELKERDEDDEWDGEVLQARLTNDDQIAFFSLDDTELCSPLRLSSIKDATGH